MGFQERLLRGMQIDTVDRGAVRHGRVVAMRAEGALLGDGTQIKLPPPAAWQMSSLLQPAQWSRPTWLEIGYRLWQGG